MNKVMHFYPEGRTETTLVNLICASEILRSLSQLVVRKYFHSVNIWNNKAITYKNGKIFEHFKVKLGIHQMPVSWH